MHRWPPRSDGVGDSLARKQKGHAGGVSTGTGRMEMIGMHSIEMSPFSMMLESHFGGDASSLLSSKDRIIPELELTACQALTRFCDTQNKFVSLQFRTMFRA